MSAYVIVDIVRVRDEGLYGAYRGRVSPTIAAAGGAYLARGGDPEALDGVWRPHRLVLVQFQDLPGAVSWWSSPAYAALKQDRQQSTDSNMAAVEGCAPADAVPSAQRTFVILDVRAVSDEPAFADFRERAPETIARRGGAYLARGGEVQVLEGGWRPGRLVILAFPDPEAARGWWADADQQALIGGLRSSTRTNVVLLHGLNERKA